MWFMRSGALNLCSAMFCAACAVFSAVLGCWPDRRHSRSDGRREPWLVFIPAAFSMKASSTSSPFLRSARAQHPTSSRWSDEEVHIVAAHVSLADSEIVTVMREYGFDRTEGSVFALRQRLKLPKRDPSLHARIMGNPRDGWPALRGTQEGRDREYARMLLRVLIEKGRAA